jgi:hypothetical protein
MRKGVNPLKNNLVRLNHKRHRIILPFWIPNVTDDYYKNQVQVLQLCLESLTETINPEQTNITLINNNSCSEARAVALEFYNKGLIDKFVERSENRGKLEPILSEARAAYEDYITVADADFYFFPGWEDAVIDVFKNFSRAGIVTCYPCCNIAFNYNTRWVWSWKWKSGKVVDDSELNLVEKGLGNSIETGIYSGAGVKRKFSWRQKQYYFKKNQVIACPGATHALSTMKKDIIKHLHTNKVEYVFKSGYEHDYLDYVSDELGYYRMSTIKCNAYHMGNTIPDDILNFNSPVFRTRTIFPEYKNRSLFVNRLLSKCSQLYVRIVRKFKLL